MKIKELIKKIEKAFPKELAESWDNVGLLVGDGNREIRKIQFSLDLTEDVINHAIEQNSNLIITHHPLIFNSIKKITSNDLIGKKLLKLIENRVAVYSLHTNIDSSNIGLNQYIVKKLGAESSSIISEKFSNIYLLNLCIVESSKEALLAAINSSNLTSNIEYINSTKKIKITILNEKNILFNFIDRLKNRLDNNFSYQIIKTENKISLGGLGRLYSLSKEVYLNEYIDIVKQKLSLSHAIVVGDEKKKIRKIAIVNGSGSSLISSLKKNKVDLYITGDIKYHEALEAKESGLAILDIGHYESEHFFHELIEKYCDNLSLEVYNDLPVFKIV